MFFNAIEKTVLDRLDISKYTLVLPAISVGNVGQLTVDILITTSQAENIGSIYDDSLLPLIGNDPYVTADSTKSCRLSTSCNVYLAKAEKLMFIQQRATFVTGKRKQYREKLIQWIKEQKFQQVILIGSTFAHMRTDQQIEGSQCRYLVTDEAKSTMPTNSDLIELEDTPDEFGRMSKRMPGSGIAKTLYLDCCRENIALVELLAFCSEGDNAPDALRMAEYSNRWLNIIRQTEADRTITELSNVWKIPLSWRLNYGNTYNKVIY